MFGSSLKVYGQKHKKMLCSFLRGIPRSELWQHPGQLSQNSVARNEEQSMSAAHSLWHHNYAHVRGRLADAHFSVMNDTQGLLFSCFSLPQTHPPSSTKLAATVLCLLAKLCNAIKVFTILMNITVFNLSLVSGNLLFRPELDCHSRGLWAPSI